MPLYLGNFRLRLAAGNWSLAARVSDYAGAAVLVPAPAPLVVSAPGGGEAGEDATEAAVEAVAEDLALLGDSNGALS